MAVEGEVPPGQVGAEGVRSAVAELAGVRVNRRVTDRALLVMKLSRQEVA